MNLKQMFIVLFCIVFNGKMAFGQEASNPLPELTATDLSGRADFSVPQSPAFVVLGVTPDNVILPTSYRSLALSFLNGLDQEGDVQRGFAVDTKPYFLAKGKSITLTDYRNDELTKQLSRMQLSFATSSSVSSSMDADRFAISLRWTPWDPADPRLDQKLEECRKIGFDSILDSSDETTVFDDDKSIRSEEIRQQLIKVDDMCREEAQKNQDWNASSWDIGLAGFRTDTESDSESGGALWTSLGLKVRDNGQLIFHFRHSENELRPMDNDAGLTFSATDRTTIGARLRYGNSRGALLLEVVGTREENVDESIEGAQYLIGAEYRLRDGIWMQLGVGDSSGDLTEDSDLVYSGQIRWAFSENRLFSN